MKITYSRLSRRTLKNGVKWKLNSYKHIKKKTLIGICMYFLIGLAENMLQAAVMGHHTLVTIAEWP